MRDQAAVVTLSVALTLALTAGRASAQADPYAPPAGYYAGVTGTGAMLQTQLGAAMAAGHEEHGDEGQRTIQIANDAPQAPEAGRRLWIPGHLPEGM